MGNIQRTTQKVSLLWHSLLHSIGNFLQWVESEYKVNDGYFSKWSLVIKSYIEAYEILERIANNNYQWPSTKQQVARGVVGVHYIDAITVLSAQVTSLTNMVKAMTSAPAVVKQVAELSCVYCGKEHTLIIVLEIQHQ